MQTLWPWGLGLALALTCIFSRRVWLHALSILWILGVTLHYNGIARIGG